MAIQDAITAAFRALILTRQLTHGSVLPTTRELASTWGVSTYTISEALKPLAGEGLIISRDRSKRVVHYPAGAVAPPPVTHLYISTYCQHTLHGDCRLTCKVCSAPCLCPCGHPDQETTDEQA